MNKHSIILALFLLLSAGLNAQRQMENLNRGVSAVRNAKGQVFISWRLLATDPTDLAFNVYVTMGNGRIMKLNGNPVGNATSILDTNTDSLKPRRYEIRPVLKGKEA